MMSEATLLESRLNKLEQANRRLKLTVGAVLLVFAAASCADAVMPQQVADRIDAKEFRVIDEIGNVRAVMSNIGVRYLDEKGTTRTSMSDGIYYWAENGVTLALMAGDGIAVADEIGSIRVRITPNGISYRENGEVVWESPRR